MIVMAMYKNIELLGDSILQGVQINPVNKHYYTKNEIDTQMLCKKFDCSIKNNSRFGCTVIKGKKLLNNMLSSGFHCDALVMDFGGNDCDYKWKDIAENPNGVFEPNTPLPLFIEEYRSMIRDLKEHEIVPILTTLPPLEPQLFFDWWCRTLNKENVIKWLKTITQIYVHQENYSKQIEILAREEQVKLIDIRKEFLNYGAISDLICEDGTHPNSEGQKLITKAFDEFFSKEQNRFVIG